MGRNMKRKRNRSRGRNERNHELHEKTKETIPDGSPLLPERVHGLGWQIVLARKVLETLESASISEPPRNMALSDVVGLLQTATPPPDDEECDRIVEQERVRKYG